MDSHQALCSIFNKLTLWRNLPKYQLERRVDIFFSLYLQDILEARLKPITLLADMIPEFPIKKTPSRQVDDEHQPDVNTTSQNKEDDNHLTVNIDYVMFSNDLKTVYLIEFKTDMGSNRREQFEYLKLAKSRIEKHGVSRILEELVTVFRNTVGKGSKGKYLHLFLMLSKLGLVSNLDGIQEKLAKASSAHGVTKLIDAIQISETANQITSAEIVFLQPEPFKAEDIRKFNLEDVICIPFSHLSDFCVINHLRSKSSDLFAHQFADYIEIWSAEAGREAPQSVAESAKVLAAKYVSSE